MKKVMRVCLALLLGIMMTVNVLADTGMAQYPDYVTDYYMIVESPVGGIDFYVEASFESSKLNNELIPNGTAFHIEGEVTDANNRVWGYSKYHGMTGYICEDNCRMVTRSEAIKSELSIAETAEADYDYVTAGEKILYNGPGEKFGKVSGSIMIPEGTTVHIEKEAKLADGSDWGYTSYHYDGWIELESLVNIEEETVVEENNAEEVLEQESTADVVNLENTDQETAETEQESAENATIENETVAALNEENGEVVERKKAEVTSTPTPKPTATNTPTPEPAATSTPTPEPTATSTPTPEPTATNTPTPEATATSTPTPEATATNAPTPEVTATSTPTPEATATNTPTPEATAASTPTEDAEKTTAEPTVTQAVQQEEASSSNVESASQWYQNPMIWIGGICILLIIILLIYHFIKKNK